MALSLEGKIALVTGGSRGIGRAIALELAGEGADVVIDYRIHAQEAQAVAADIMAMDRRALPVQANMADPAEIDRLFQVITDELGGLDLLICNAAAGYWLPVMEQTVKSWDLAMGVNAR